MNLTSNHRVLVLLAVIVLAFGVSATTTAEESADDEIYVERLHKVVIDCDEQSDEDCESRVRVHVRGGDHDVEVGDHRRVWVQAGDHGLHQSFRLGMHGEGGYLGIQLTDLTAELRIHFGVSEDEGVMVAKVVDDSAAFRAGLAAGDIITGVDGESIGSSMDLTRAIRSREEGDTVSLEVWRDGSVSAVTATLDKSEIPHMAHKTVVIDCDDDERDCDFDFTGHAAHDIDFDCPEGEECDVRIDCSGGDCDCSVNGESIDCPALHEAHPGD